MSGQRAAQLMVMAGAGGWVPGRGARGGPAPTAAEAMTAGELLQMAAAGLLLLGIFTFARTSPWRSTAPRARASPILRLPAQPLAG